MNKDTAEKIYQAYIKDGLNVMIHSHYVDGFARLYKKDNVVMIDSQVWSETPLTELEFRITLYKPITVSDLLEAHANPA